MKKKIKVLIVAKPWQGGLYEYYFNAFKRCVNVEPQLCFTYPNSFFDYVAYKKNKKIWFDKLIKKINQFKYDIGFFINTFNNFEKLTKRNNILYLTDDALFEKSKSELFKNIYLSDIGYASKFSDCDNYMGELPFGFDPYLHKYKKSFMKRKLVQSIANIDVNRSKWFKLMDENNCFPNIYGNYFSKSKYLLKHPFKIHPTIDHKKQGLIYSKYLISLNIHARVIKYGTNMKTFEACGFEVPQIINQTQGLENFFEPNEEIIIFSNIHEYKEKLELLEKDAKLRNKLAQNSFKRAMSMHKYDDRVNFIMNNFRLS